MSGPVEGKYICNSPSNWGKYNSLVDECLSHMEQYPAQLANIKANNRVCCTKTQLVTIIDFDNFDAAKPLL